MLEYPPKNTEKDFDKIISIATREEVTNINSAYPYWDKVKYMPVPKEYSVEDLWLSLKLLRQLDSTALTFGKYSFHFTVTDEMLELLHHFDMNIGGNLTSENLIPDANRNRYLVSSIMEEAIASSQMEGAATTRKVAKDMLRKSEKPRNKGQQMILNNYITINFIKENASSEFSIELLKEIHHLMTENTLEDSKDVGRFRTNNDVVVMDGITGEIAHTPPPYNEIEDLLRDLETFFNVKGKTFIHPIVKGIIIHFMLAYIHPFVDGNGRTSRSLFYWYMIRQGYWMIEYMSISRIIYKTKRQYEKSFLYTEYDDNDLTYFILYNLRSMKKAFEELKLYLKRKAEESNSLVLLSNIEGINQRQAQIVKILQEKPNSSFTVKEIENRFSVGNQTARTDLEGLVAMEFMTEIQVNKVKKAYIKSNTFDAKIKSSS